jgi:serine phosphatase RsbU (regulator of sigma subunit)
VLRTALRLIDPVLAVNRTAQGLEQDLAETGTFVTLLLASLVPSSGVLRYVDAGHGLALIITMDGEVHRLGSGDLPLGVLADSRWESRTTRLAPGDTLLMVSDGVLDLFPTLDHAIGAAVKKSGMAASAAELVEAVAAYALDGSPSDDVTVIAVRRTYP